jgi:DNA polymerase (family 10)
VALRRLALAQGLRLNEYGLFRGEKRIAGKTEEEVYAALSLPYLRPEERLGGGEIRAALQTARERTR